MKDLEAIFPKKKKEKDRCKSIRQSIGDFLKKSEDFLDNVNNLNDDNQIDNLINVWYTENKDKNKALVSYDGDINELFEALRVEFLSNIPRKYCIYKNGLSGSYLFSNIEEMLKFSPELKGFKHLKDDIAFYLGFESNKRILERFKRVVIRNNNPKESFTTLNKNEIHNFAPIIFDFLNQSDKRIFIFDDGTGYGKSYSINEFIALAIGNEHFYNLINHIFYITDRKNNVEQEYNDFISKHRELEDSSLLVLSNEDCVLNNIDELKKFPDRLKNHSSYKKLLNFAKYRKTYQDEDSKELFREYESNYRAFLKIELNSIFKENKIITYNEKLNFLYQNKEFNCVVKAYPNMLIKARKILFINTDKFYLPVDTVIEKEVIVFHQNKKLMKNSVVIIDESDAAAEKFLDRICDETLNTQIDLIEKTYLFYNGFSFKNIHSKYLTPEISNRIDVANSRFKAIIKKYHIDYDISFVGESRMDDRFLFIKNNKNFVHANNSQNNFKMIFDETEGRVYLDIKDENTIPFVPYNDFIRELSSLYREYQRIVKKMANVFIENNSSCEINQLNAIQMILAGLFISKDHKTRDGIIRDISMISKEEYDNKRTNDFYLNPGCVIRTIVDDDEPENIKINSYSLQSTPENYLRQLLDCGAYLVLSSATANNKSKFKNFNLDWEPLKSRVFKPSEHAVKLSAEYRKSREKNACGINLNIQQCPKKEINDDEDSLVEEILSFYQTEKKSLIRDLLNEFKAVIVNNMNKDNDSKKSDSNYKISEHFIYIVDCLDKLNAGSIANLMLLNFNLKNDEKELVENILKEYSSNCHIFSSDASQMEATLEQYKDEVLNNVTCFLFTTYAAAEKGYNFKVKLDKEKNKFSLVAINDLGERDLEEKDFVSVDLTGIYIGNITHVAPSIDKRDKRSRTKSILKNIYYTNSLYDGNDLAIEKVIEKIFDGGEKYPFAFAGRDNLEIKDELQFAESASIIAHIQQAIGRGGRCNIRLKNKHISINRKIIEHLKKNMLDIKDIVPDEVIVKQSYEVRKVLEFLDEELQDVQRINMAATIDESNDLYSKALTENCNGNPKLLKNLQNNLTGLFITKEEYEALDKNVKRFYIQNDGFLVSGYSYNQEGEDSFGNKETRFLYKIREKKLNVSYDSLGLSDIQLEIIKDSNIKVEKRGSKNGYVMLPRGFDTLCGNIGEYTTKYLFDKYLGILLEELPDKIYEQMDLLYEFDDYVLVVDAKHYTVHNYQHDDRKELESKYNDKLIRIKKFYNNKKIIGVVFNTRDNGVCNYKMEVHDLDDGNKLITVPNIYKDGDIDNVILESLNREILINI